MINRIDIDNYTETNDFIGKQALIRDYDNLITVDTDIYIDGVLSLEYRVSNGIELSMIKKLVIESNYTGGKRTNGLSVYNAIYGYMPRNPTRCARCRPTSSSKTNVSLHTVAVNYANLIEGKYSGSKTDSVKSLWLLGKSRFSTLNINKNHAIKYHRDSGNITDYKSNVFIYRTGCIGGDLVLPHAKIALEQKMGAFIIFRGNDIVHGVTPIIPIKKKYVRASAVLYTMNDMKHCLSYGEESVESANRYDEIANEKRNGNPKLRLRYAKKIKEFNNRDNV